MNRRLIVTATTAAFRLVVCVLAWAGGVATASAADAVTYWGHDEYQCGRALPGRVDRSRESPSGNHDAVQAFEHTAEPYCADIDNAFGSPVAAIARAARDVLVAQLPPAQDAAVEAAYQAYLAANGLGGDAGLVVGQEAAECILAERADDGSFPNPSPTFFGGTKPGEWRPTTATLTYMVTPWLGYVAPFALKDSSQVRADVGAPALTSGLYRRDYDEVKSVGAKNSTTRTAEQKELANFYSENLVVLIQRTLRTVVDTYARNPGESARVMALANVAAADAAIATWNAKVHYNFWRPVTAIREGETTATSSPSATPRGSHSSPRRTTLITRQAPMPWLPASCARCSCSSAPTDCRSRWRAERPPHCRSPVCTIAFPMCAKT